MIPSNNIAACNPYFKVSNFDWKSFGAGLLTGGVSSIIKDASKKKTTAPVMTDEQAKAQTEALLSASDKTTTGLAATQAALDAAKTKKNTTLYIGIGVAVVIVIIIIFMLRR